MKSDEQKKITQLTQNIISLKKELTAIKEKINEEKPLLIQEKIKPWGNSSHIPLEKKHLGKEALVVILNHNNL